MNTIFSKLQDYNCYKSDIPTEFEGAQDVWLFCLYPTVLMLVLTYLYLKKSYDAANSEQKPQEHIGLV